MSEQQDDYIAADQVLTVEEGVAVVKRITARKGARQWHWMGNYGSVYDAANVANQAGCGAGEIEFNFVGDLIPAWMYY